MENPFLVLDQKKPTQPEPIDPVLIECVYNRQWEPKGLDDPNYVAYFPLAKW